MHGLMIAVPVLALLLLSSCLPASTSSTIVEVDVIPRPPNTVHHTTHIGSTNAEQRFAIYNDKLNWFEALNNCTAQGMRLATIKSQEEQDRLVQQLKEVTNEHCSTRSWWIGGSDLLKEGEFIWYSTGQPMEYSNNFHPNTSPISHGRQPQCEDNHCLEMFDWFHDHQWNNHFCSDRQGFICSTDTPINNPKKNFRIFLEEVNWFGGLLHCISNNMTLATIVSQQEQDQVKQLIEQTVPNNGTGKYWLGGADLHKEKDLAWYSTGEPLNYTNFRTGEPNNQINEDCLELVVGDNWNNKNWNYEWNDNNCDYSHYFICEFL